MRRRATAGGRSYVYNRTHRATRPAMRSGVMSAPLGACPARSGGRRRPRAPPRPLERPCPSARTACTAVVPRPRPRPPRTRPASRTPRAVSLGVPGERVVEGPMTHAERNDDTPAVDDEVEERLDDLADELQEPRHDEDERRRRRQAADEAESNPRRDA